MKKTERKILGRLAYHITQADDPTLKETSWNVDNVSISEV